MKFTWFQLNRLNLTKIKRKNSSYISSFFYLSSNLRILLCHQIHKLLITNHTIPILIRIVNHLLDFGMWEPLPDTLAHCHELLHTECPLPYLSNICRIFVSVISRCCQSWTLIFIRRLVPRVISCQSAPWRFVRSFQPGVKGRVPWWSLLVPQVRCSRPCRSWRCRNIPWVWSRHQQGGSY